MTAIEFESCRGAGDGTRVTGGWRPRIGLRSLHYGIRGPLAVRSPVQKAVYIDRLQSPILTSYVGILLPTV